MLCEQYNKSVDGVNAEIFKWKELVSRNEADFAKTLYSISGLDANGAKLEFIPAELGEIRNLFDRVDEIIEVLLHPGPKILAIQQNCLGLNSTLFNATSACS